MRVGIGYDVHALLDNTGLILGGVDIPHTQGLKGHSDGDALTHAIIDAVLGAASLGDIGGQFPSSNALYKNARSLDLLKTVVSKLHDKGWRVGNVDATIVAQRPTLAGYTSQMAINLASAMGVKTSQINVKATTTDGLGFAGMEEGLAAYAIALLEEQQ